MDKWWGFFDEYGGKLFPKKHLQKAIDEIEELCNILRHEGVVVRRPDIIDWTKPYETPYFKTTGDKQKIIGQSVHCCAG